MAKKKPKKSQKKTAAKKKRTLPKKKLIKREALSQQEQKMSIIAEYLEEVFHLIGHSVQQGTAAQNPWQEIMSAMISFHNQLDSNAGHQIQEIILSCGCPTKEHRIKAEKIDHDCGGIH